ncbi:MAG: DUF4956 domain-containing protein [Lachnospiraceae bacterium]|nr:DUF4956 domain-containing protein [Lachnospiraceae bacterium]
MMETLFENMNTLNQTDITLGDFTLTIVAALVLGAILALTYKYKSNPTKSFVVTLAILPAVVSVVILMVSGSLGAGVAVAGTFSLVRFRSAPGTAKEIGAIFMSMAVGLACGMGFMGAAVVFTVIMCIVVLIYEAVGFGNTNHSELNKTLNITVPEDLDYGEIFDEIWERYTKKVEMLKVKTTNLGSLNKITYNITLKEKGIEKSLIDDLRTRNGNLEISMSNQATEVMEL